MRVSAPVLDLRGPVKLITTTFRLCRGNSELKYEAKGDDDPSVPAWDDAGHGLSEDLGSLAITA